MGEYVMMKHDGHVFKIDVRAFINCDDVIATYEVGEKTVNIWLDSFYGNIIRRKLLEGYERMKSLESAVKYVEQISE